MGRGTGQRERASTNTSRASTNGPDTRRILSGGGDRQTGSRVCAGNVRAERPGYAADEPFEGLAPTVIEQLFENLGGTCARKGRHHHRRSTHPTWAGLGVFFFPDYQPVDWNAARVNPSGGPSRAPRL